MSTQPDATVPVQGLGELDTAIYRRWVRVVLWVTVAGYGTVFAAGLATRGIAFPAVTQFVVLSAALVSLWLVRRGQLRAAVVLPLLAAWVDLQGTLALTGGEGDYGMIALPVLVLVTGVVYGTRPAVLLAGVSTVTSGGLVMYAVLVNQVPVALSRAVYGVVVTGAAMFATAAIISLAIRAFASVLAEARLTARHLGDLMAHAPDGILVLAGDGGIEAANPAAVSILGRSEEELVGSTLEEIFAGLSAEAEEGALGDLGEPSEEGAPRTVSWRMEGRIVWVDVTARDYALGGTLGRQVMLRDVTLRRRALEEQRRVRERLEEGQRMEAVGRLAGGIAHDFRNLLTVVGSSAELIAEDTEGEPRRLAEEIGEAAQRASSLTAQLLAFARKEIIQPVALDLVDVLLFMEVGIRHLLGPHRTLDLRLSATAPEILVDRSQLEQVIFNLVKNAADALDEGGRLEIAVTPPLARVTGPLGSVYHVPSGFVELRVSDDGDGMDTETLEHAFEPYFSTKDASEGSGLGLSSVHGIVTQSGGQLRMESRPSVGTSVHIFWPVAAAARGGQTEGGAGA